MNTEEQSLPSMKTLGIQWEAQHDEFTFSVMSNTDKKLTKRMFLSKISQIFDPIGFLGPVIITGKILMQEIWTRATEWDEVLDDDLNRRAQDWFSELDKDIRDAKISLWTRTPDRYSDWQRFVRVCAWVNRYVKNCRTNKQERQNGELKLKEIQDVENRQIRKCQEDKFATEFKSLRKGQSIPASSKLKNLLPYIVEDGLMRMSGRLEYAQYLAPQVKSPVILPRKSDTTRLIIKKYHEKNRHAGTNQTLANVCLRFWIISAREAIRECEKECSECRKRKTQPGQQVMAPLPAIRFGDKNTSRAFDKCAVDFAGPFVTVQGRSKKRQKRYLCVFTCLTYRAVHLEIAYGLDTDSFINALCRMTSRRVIPSEMISDDGKNFIGAVNELRTLTEQLDSDRILRTAANEGIKWRFNPPGAPHFGGVFESMVKSSKRAIYAILGTADINDEELYTAFVSAEDLINSRPLTYQSANPCDNVPLTPNHFLFWQSGGQFAPETVKNHPHRRWRRVQDLMRHVWKRWMTEWLPMLNPRKKWNRTSRDISEGEIVLVVSPDNQRGQWPLGRVTEVYPGKDGHIRVVKLKVGDKLLKRPVTKLCPLEVGCDND